MSLPYVRFAQLSGKLGIYLVDNTPCVPDFERDIVGLKECLEEFPRLGGFNYLKFFRNIESSWSSFTLCRASTIPWMRGVLPGL